jgi:hypothetical protein
MPLIECCRSTRSAHNSGPVQRCTGGLGAERGYENPAASSQRSCSHSAVLDSCSGRTGAAAQLASGPPTCGTASWTGALTQSRLTRPIWRCPRLLEAMQGLDSQRGGALLWVCANAAKCRHVRLQASTGPRLAICTRPTSPPGTMSSLELIVLCEWAGGKTDTCSSKKARCAWYRTTPGRDPVQDWVSLIRGARGRSSLHRATELFADGRRTEEKEVPNEV